jgi:nucleoside-diphosphate-sugar epimerase
LFELVSSGAEVQLRGPSDSRRDYVHVSDVVEAICRSTDYLMNNCQGESAYRVLNVGTGIGTTLVEVLGQVEQLLDRPARARRVPSETAETVTSYADLTELEAVLDFRPATAFSKGMAEFSEWRKSGRIESLRGSEKTCPAAAGKPS